jgi:hypothetical protein
VAKKKKTKKASKKFNLKNFLINKLRRASYSWPSRKEALQKARVSRGKYKCAMCEDDKLYGPKEINVDHIEPVLSPHEGFIDFNTYIDRLFCDVNGFQILCIHHHDIKTALEDEIRKLAKKDLKAKREEDEEI